MDCVGKISVHYNWKIVFLVLEKAPYYISTLVAERVDELNIKLHFLPPYSADINPIERLWKLMNEHVRRNLFLKDAKYFRDAIDGFCVSPDFEVS